MRGHTSDNKAQYLKLKREIPNNQRGGAVSQLAQDPDLPIEVVRHGDGSVAIRLKNAIDADIFNDMLYNKWSIASTQNSDATHNGLPVKKKKYVGRSGNRNEIILRRDEIEDFMSNENKLRMWKDHLQSEYAAHRGVKWIDNDTLSDYNTNGKYRNHSAYDPVLYPMLKIDPKDEEVLFNLYVNNFLACGIVPSVRPVEKMFVWYTFLILLVKELASAGKMFKDHDFSGVDFNKICHTLALMGAREYFELVRRYTGGYY